MLPSAFVILSALPLTPNGKVDRLALPKPDQVRQEQEESFVAPQDDLEYQLARIWESILDIPSVGVKDNFFDLGGHSLLAVRLFAQIQKSFGKELPLTILFQAKKRATWYYYPPKMGWDGLSTGGLEIYEIPGDHISIFQKPHVRFLAERLRVCLNRVQ